MQRSASNLTLFVSRSGSGDALPLVFVNGLGGMQESWFFQVRHFSETREVVTYDHRGNGRSPYIEGPARLETYLEDLLELLDREAIAIADFVGISFGGRLLQLLALRAPERVRRLCLVATTAAPSQDTGTHPLREMTSMGEDRFMDEVVPLLFGPRYVAANQKRLRAFARGRQRLGMDPRGIEMQWKAICHFDMRSRLSELSHPTLVVHGKEDALTPFRAAERLVDGLADATLVALEEVGHSPQVENWPAFNRALQDFLNGPVA